MNKILIILASIFLSSCSKVDFAYYIFSNRLKSFMENSYEFNNSKDEKAILQSWNSDLKANKSPVFKEFANLLSQIEQVTSDNIIIESEVKKIFESFSEKQKKIILMYEKSISLTLSLVKEEELKNHQKYLLKKIEDQEKKYKTLNELYVKRFRKILDFIFDSVNEPQLALVEVFIDKNSHFVNAP